MGVALESGGGLWGSVNQNLKCLEKAVTRSFIVFNKDAGEDMEETEGVLLETRTGESFLYKGSSLASNAIAQLHRL